jgi:hypothetical protein
LDVSLTARGGGVLLRRGGAWQMTNIFATAKDRRVPVRPQLSSNSRSKGVEVFILVKQPAGGNA